MYEKELLRKLINYEFDKIRQCGDKIRIKSVTRKRTFSTVFALLLIVLYLLGSSTGSILSLYNFDTFVSGFFGSSFSTILI